jgi:hypothetical protein
VNSFKRRALPLLAAGAVTLSSILPAQAGPPQVSMNAGGCGGLGTSVLLYPGGSGGTSGCAGSARYLSVSLAFTGGGGDFLPGDWYNFDFAWGNSGTGVPGPVSALASTHNLGYVSTYHGWEGTNTW